MVFKVTCDCGFESKGSDPRKVEAMQWHHAIRDHNEMLKGMSIDQFTQIMKSWDKQMKK